MPEISPTEKAYLIEGVVAEGSEEEAQIARIGAALAAWDEEMG